MGVRAVGLEDGLERGTLMNGINTSDWAWTISEQDVREVQRFADPGLRDVLVGWTDPPIDVPWPRRVGRRDDRRATA